MSNHKCACTGVQITNLKPETFVLRKRQCAELMMKAHIRSIHKTPQKPSAQDARRKREKKSQHIPRSQS